MTALNFRSLPALCGLLLFSLFSLGFAMLYGSESTSIYQLISLFFGQADSETHSILLSVRLPRVASAFVTGGLLAISGSLLQILLRNPLADPYILGVSSGGSLATLVAILLGAEGWFLTMSAWGGCCFVIFIIFALTRRHDTLLTERLVLTGIALASGLSALISLILTISPNDTLRGMLFWLMGDLSDAPLPIIESLLLITGLLISFSKTTELNLLMRGEREARALGLDTKRLYRQLFLLSSIMTAAAVTLAGCIGFVGLIIPHLFRLLFGSNHRFLLPGSVLMGGSFLTLADTLARTLFSPLEIPTGIIMTLIGIPLFIFLLYRAPQ